MPPRAGDILSVFFTLNHVLGRTVCSRHGCRRDNDSSIALAWRLHGNLRVHNRWNGLDSSRAAESGLASSPAAESGWTAFGLPNDTLLTTGWVALSRMWFRFRRVVLVLGVARMYDLGFGVLLRTVEVSIGHLDHGSELLDRFCVLVMLIRHVVLTFLKFLSHFIVVFARVHDLCQKSRLHLTTIEELCRTWKLAVNRRCS